MVTESPHITVVTNTAIRTARVQCLDHIAEVVEFDAQRSHRFRGACICKELVLVPSDSIILVQVVEDNRVIHESGIFLEVDAEIDIELGETGLAHFNSVGIDNREKNRVFVTVHFELNLVAAALLVTGCDHIERVKGNRNGIKADTVELEANLRSVRVVDALGRHLHIVGNVDADLVLYRADFGIVKVSAALASFEVLDMATITDNRRHIVMVNREILRDLRHITASRVVSDRIAFT